MASNKTWYIIEENDRLNNHKEPFLDIKKHIGVNDDLQKY